MIFNTFALIIANEIYFKSIKLSINIKNQMKTNKITAFILILLLQVAVKAQTTTVNYTYDASGNRQSRTFNVQPIAPPQNNNF